MLKKTRGIYFKLFTSCLLKRLLVATKADQRISESRWLRKEHFLHVSWKFAYQTFFYPPVALLFHAFIYLCSFRHACTWEHCGCGVWLLRYNALITPLKMTSNCDWFIYKRDLLAFCFKNYWIVLLATEMYCRDEV